MKISKRQLRRIIREELSISRSSENIHEAGIGRKLFGWMKDKDWEQETERIETAENIKTIGDLKFVLDLAKLAKTDEKAEKAWSGFATGFIADLLGGGTVKSLADVVTDTYEAPDEATGGTALDYLNVDDGIAKIVDDPIENAYLEDLEDMIKDQDPETRLEDFDVTKGLAKFIKKNIDDRTVTGWDGQQEGKNMKITKRHVKRIIKEELIKLLNEAYDTPDSDHDYVPSPPHSKPLGAHGIGQQPIRSEMHASAERLMDMYHDIGIEVETKTDHGQEYLEVHYPGGDVEMYRNEDDAEQDIELRQKEGGL